MDVIVPLLTQSKLTPEMLNNSTTAIVDPEFESRSVYTCLHYQISTLITSSIMTLRLCPCSVGVIINRLVFIWIAQMLIRHALDSKPQCRHWRKNRDRIPCWSLNSGEVGNNKKIYQELVSTQKKQRKFKGTQRDKEECCVSLKKESHHYRQCLFVLLSLKFQCNFKQIALQH